MDNRTYNLDLELKRCIGLGADSPYDGEELEDLEDMLAQALIAIRAIDSESTVAQLVNNGLMRLQNKLRGEE